MGVLHLLFVRLQFHPASAVSALLSWRHTKRSILNWHYGHLKGHTNQSESMNPIGAGSHSYILMLRFSNFRGSNRTVIPKCSYWESSKNSTGYSIQALGYDILSRSAIPPWRDNVMVGLEKLVYRQWG